MSEARLYPGTGANERTHFAPYGAFEVPADLRELHGRYDVEATARRVRNFRYAEEWSMLILGGWLATVPEVPVKTGLGKVVWECAQAADALGKRLPELRCGRRAVAASESPNQGFARFVEALAAPETPGPQHREAGRRVRRAEAAPGAGLRDAASARPTQIADAPTIEILEEILRRTRRHVAWGQEVLDRLCDTDARRERRRARGAELEAQLAACGGVTGAGL